jgi:hypothetical protein
VTACDELLVRLEDVLVPLGYRRDGYTFNREREQGFVHVVEVRADSKAFNLDLCVFIEEVWTELQSWVPEAGRIRASVPHLIRNGHTQIRTPMHNALPHPDPIRKGSWPLDDEGLRRGVADLQQWGLPFLERLASRDAVVQAWRSLDFERVVGYEVRAEAARMRQAGRNQEANELQQRAMLAKRLPGVIWASSPARHGPSGLPRSSFFAGAMRRACARFCGKMPRRWSERGTIICSRPCAKMAARMGIPL